MKIRFFDLLGLSFLSGLSILSPSIADAEELEKSGYPMTVIDASEFPPRAVTVTDLLDRVPGVTLSKTEDLGGRTFISLRGLDGERIEVYIDGAPVIVQDGFLALDDLPLHVIEKIEVYKGVVPARFGGDSVGVAVNIVTSATPHDYMDLSYGVMRYNRHAAHAMGQLYFEKPGINWVTGIFGQFAENDYEMPVADGESVVRDHDRYKHLIAATSLHFKKWYFDELELELIYMAEAEEIQGIPGYTGGSTESPVRNVQRAHTWGHTGIAALHAARGSFLTDKLDFTYSLIAPFRFSGLVDKSDTVYDFAGNSAPSPTGEGEIGIGPNDSKDKRFGVQQEIDLKYRIVEPFALNLNNRLQYTSNRPEDKSADEAAGYPITPQPAEQLYAVTGLSGELGLFRDRWMTVAGFNHYFYRSKGHEKSLFQTSDSADAEEKELKDNGFGGTVSTRVKIVDGLMLKSSYEYSRRMPTAEEVFGNGFDISPSPELKPEKSHNILGGFYLEKAFGEGHTRIVVRLEADAFLMFIDDMIQSGGLTTSLYGNMDKVKVRGTDGELQLQLTRYFYTYFGWTYQDVRNNAEYLPGTTQPNSLKDKRMPDIPPYFFNWGAEIAIFDLFGKWAAPTELSLFYDGTYVSEYLYEYEVSEDQRRLVASQITHNAGLLLSLLKKRYCISASFLNFTNEQHRDLLSKQPLPGWMFKVALRGTFY